MNKIFIGIIVLVLFLGIGFFLMNKKPTQEAMGQKGGSNSLSSVAMQKEGAENLQQVIEKDKTMMLKDNTQQMEKSETMVKTSSYVVYSKAAFDEAKGKKRVYFFHATWCPTCKAENEALTKNVTMISEDVVVFKTDYDSEVALKKQYGITYQHTFVLVDDMGKELKKWNGNGLETIKTL